MNSGVGAVPEARRHQSQTTKIWSAFAWFDLAPRPWTLYGSPKGGPIIGDLLGP